jgi:predicted RNase H-like HicB family nuclease
MAIHEEVLRAALRICRERGNWTFTPVEIVRALPHVNPRSVRTHIVSRCCIDAPKNHPHKWDYFRRIRRGTYVVASPYRQRDRARPASRVAEEHSLYSGSPSLRDSIHATITRGERAFVAECLEVAVVTQGRTLDEVMSNLAEAVALHLDGEDHERLGLTREPRLIVTYEQPLANASTP